MGFGNGSRGYETEICACNFMVMVACLLFLSIFFFTNLTFSLLVLFHTRAKYCLFSLSIQLLFLELFSKHYIVQKERESSIFWLNFTISGASRGGLRKSDSKKFTLPYFEST